MPAAHMLVTGYGWTGSGVEQIQKIRGWFEAELSLDFSHLLQTKVGLKSGVSVC